jgi:hypothetical protein
MFRPSFAASLRHPGPSLLAVVLGCALSAPLRAAQPEKAAKTPTLAVMDFDARKLEGADLEVLRDALTVELQNSGRVRVMERSQMNTILKEQGFQKSGACDASECAVEMGKLLSVDRMVLGSLGKLGETWSMTLRLVNVQTGEVLASVRDSRTGTIDVLLRESVPHLSSQILRDMPAAGTIAASPNASGAAYTEAFALVKSKAFRDKEGFESLQNLSARLSPAEAYQLNETGSLSRGWAWANIYPFLPIGSMVQGDWAGVGWIYLGWAPALIAIKNAPKSDVTSIVVLSSYVWQIARPILFANRSNEQLKRGLRLSRAAIPTPSLLPLSNGQWQGSLAWTF